mgnify:CR=1 FL=1
MIVPFRAFLYYLNKNIRGKSFHSPPLTEVCTSRSRRDAGVRPWLIAS